MESMPILGDLSDEQFESILSICTKMEMDSGKTVFHEGSSSYDMFILTEGAVKVTLWGVEIGRIFPINMIGEMGIFTDEVRSATIVTLTKCTLLKISKVQLFNLFNYDRDLYIHFQKSMLLDMSKKIRSSNETIAKLKSVINKGL